MHILLVHRAFAQTNQAGGTRHIELARELVSKGHRITVVTAAVPYLHAASEHSAEALPAFETLAPGIEVVRCASGNSGRSFIGRLNEMFGFMARGFFAGMTVKAVDLVWATSPTLFQAMAAAMVAMFKRKTLLLEIRDVWPDALVDIGAIRNPLAISVAHALAHWLYRQADCIVINSPGFRDLLATKGVPTSKIHLVPNGVDTSMFNPDDAGAEVRALNGWTGHFVALYSGAHGMANDLDTLVEAAAALQDCPNIRLVLLGDGPEKVRLIEKVKAMHLGNVQFLDPVPKSAMPCILAGADCCVAHLMPSAMQALVYPNKVFDYMAAARPTILGIGGVIREVIEKAGGGLCTEPGDAVGLATAIRHLAHNPKEGQVMGLQARAYVEANFQREVIAGSLLTTIDLVSRQPTL